MITNVRIRTKLIATFVAMAVIVSLTGVFGVYFTSQTGSQGATIGKELYPVAAAAMELQVNAVNAHLALEQVLNGSPAANSDNIWLLLDKSMEYCDAIIFGKTVDGYNVPATQDMRIKEHVETAKSSIITLKNSLQLRYKEIQVSLAAAVESENQYNTQFAAIQKALDRVREDYGKTRRLTLANISGEIKYLLSESRFLLGRSLADVKVNNMDRAIDNLNAGKQKAEQIEKMVGINKFLQNDIDRLELESKKRFELARLNQAGYQETRRIFNQEFSNFIHHAQKAEELTIQDVQSNQDSLLRQILNSKIILAVITLAGIVMGLILSIVLSLYLVKQIANLKQSANSLAAGDLEVNLQSPYQDEIAELNNSFQKMVNALQAKIQLAEKIGDGVLTDDAELSSESDMLGKSLQNMIESLRKKTELAQEIARGNLDIEIKLTSDNDALGISFQQMIQTLNDVLLRVASIATELKDGSTQISTSRQGLSQAVNEQAASLEQISSSMEQLDSQTRSNAENAKAANLKAVESKSRAENGFEQMQEMVQAMNEINTTADQISNIIKTIDEIAFQTNVLAINAAVEAARAGEHGKGFAVVAEEVRNLAQRSAQASKETTTMINNSIKKIESGVNIAQETAHSLDAIMKDAGDVTELVEKIVGSSNEQALGVSQVNQGITQLNSVVQSNAAVADQTAESSERLDSFADLLKQLVSRFHLKGQAYHPESEQKLEFNTGAKQLTSGTLESFEAQNELKPEEPPTQQVDLDENIILFEDEDLGRF
ncbi:MAG: methyl-accepting chemotaxis protein [Proteobacteria bacterium]|nr:methyl-accepting chemotaxis protein [Pseudomonadota bacterium]